MRYPHPANLEAEPEGGFTVTSDGLPGATWGGDLLVSALSFLVDDGVAIVRPGKANGRPMVSVTMLDAAKLALHDAIVVGKISNVELASRLGIDEKSVRRLRDPLHASKIDLVEKALRAVGWRVASVEFGAA